MAPLRFRAWHPTEKRMIYPKHGDLLCVNDHGEIEYWFGGTTKCNIQWSTGLEDKNGKEIFEGDILRLEYPAYKEGILIFPLPPDHPVKTTIGKMEWNSGYGGFAFKSKDDIELLPKAVMKFAEVIGNIYENPDLLS